MMNISIRRIRQSDLPVIQRTWKVIKPFEKRLLTQKHGEGIFLLMFVDGKLIGHGKLVCKSPPVIEDMFVSFSQRSKGLGSIMLKRLENTAKKRGHDRVVLYVDSKNVRAKQLYSRNGYRKIRCIGDQIKYVKNLKS